MKKIILFMTLILSGVILSAQTGTGWAQQRSKVNFKDSINIANGWRIGGTDVIPSITEINYLDSAQSQIQRQIDAINLDTLDSHSVHPNWADSATINGWTSKTDFNAGQALKVNVSDSVNASGYTTKSDFNVAISNVEKDNFLRGTQAFGSTVKAYSLGFTGVASAASALVDGVAMWIPVYLDKSDSITGVMFGQAVQGNFNQNNNNRIGLYSVSGTTYTLVASTPNDSTVWDGATNTVISMAFTKVEGKRYYAEKGAYVVCLLYNHVSQTAAPQLFTSGSMSAIGAYPLFMPDHKLCGYSSQTDLPATEVTADISGHTPLFIVALYGD